MDSNCWMCYSMFVDSIFSLLLLVITILHACVWKAIHTKWWTDTMKLKRTGCAEAIIDFEQALPPNLYVACSLAYTANITFLVGWKTVEKSFFFCRVSADVIYRRRTLNHIRHDTKNEHSGGTKKSNRIVETDTAKNLCCIAYCSEIQPQENTHFQYLKKKTSRVQYTI